MNARVTPTRTLSSPPAEIGRETPVIAHKGPVLERAEIERQMSRMHAKNTDHPPTPVFEVA